MPDEQQLLQLHKFAKCNVICITSMDFVACSRLISMQSLTQAASGSRQAASNKLKGKGWSLSEVAWVKMGGVVKSVWG